MAALPGDGEEGRQLFLNNPSPLHLARASELKGLHVLAGGYVSQPGTAPATPIATARSTTISRPVRTLKCGTSRVANRISRVLEISGELSLIAPMVPSCASCETVSGSIDTPTI